jgi:hypothetical protein
MKIFISLSIIFTFGFCLITQAQTHHYTQKRDKQWALAKIRALPEVKAFMKSARKSQPMLMIEQDPDSTNKYYCIAEGVGNFNMFRTTIDYFVDPKTGRIYLNDVMDNSTDDLWHIISLQQARYWRKDPRFHKWHIIKGNKLIVLDKNGK